MKVIVRASVLTLVFAGALASAFVPRTHASSAKATTNVMAVSAAFPFPSCPPNDPKGCGILLK